ncbi:MAG TPA: hypothetical protein EYM95_11750 [Candidatus Obscuribacterales bacterium]|jgi:cell division protein FtsL|nr:hypothetical protein [Candidatus Obscuribacterales bacterium]
MVPSKTRASSVMSFMRINKPFVFASAAIFLSVPSLWDYNRERYLLVKDSHTAMLNEEARLKQRKSDLSHEINDLHSRLYQKQRHLDAVNARLAVVQSSLKDLERQM